MAVGLVHAYKRWNIPFQIQEDVDFDRSLGSLPASPGEQRHAQVDHGCIQRKQVAVQVQLGGLIGIESSRSAHQHRGNLGKNLLVAMLVRIGEIAPLHLSANPRMIKYAASRSQAGLDIPQAFSVRQLSEDHRHKMIVRGKSRRVAQHRIQAGATRKLFARESTKNLSQYRFATIHAPIWRDSSSKTQIDHMPSASLPLALKSVTKVQYVVSQTAVGCR